jgi:hypothetical protein
MTFTFYLLSTILLSKVIDFKFIKKNNIYIILFFLFSLHSYLYFLSLIFFVSIPLKIIIAKNILLIFLISRLNNSLSHYLVFKELSKDHNLILFLILLFIFFILSQNLEFTKFDEISSYGLYTKYIYYYREFPNFDILTSKNTVSSINFFSFFHLIILDLFNIYSESLLIFSCNLISLTLIFSIIQILNIKKLIKTTIVFFIISSFIYILLSGFDRIYLETILGLILLNIFFLIYFDLNKHGSDEFKFILILLCILILVKKNSLLLFFGFSGILFISLLYKKKFIKMLLVLILPLLILETSNNLTKYKFQINKDLSITRYESNRNIIGASINKYLISKESYEINQINKTQFDAFENLEFDAFENLELSKKLIKNHLYKSFTNGVYHAYFLKNFKNLFTLINNYNLNFVPNIPVNIYLWSIIIIYLFYKNFKNLIFLVYYFLYLITYYFFLIFWGFKYSLFDYENYIIQVSWERHIGLIIFPMIMFLLLIKFNNYKTKTIGIIIIILLLILPTRTVRAFVPIKYLNDKNYYKILNRQKEYWKDFSFSLNEKLNFRSNVIVLPKIFNDQLDFHLLNYYSINHNIHHFNDTSLKSNIENVFGKKQEIFIITNNKFLCEISMEKIDSYFLYKIEDQKKFNSFLDCYIKNLQSR